MINFIIPLRIVQAVLAIIVLGLSAYVTNDSVGWTQAHFLVFASVWTFVALTYLVVSPIYFPTMHNRWVVLATEFVTMVFWFAGFIAMAVSDSFPCHDYGYGWCSVIDSGKAAAALGAFEWLAWAITFGLIVHAIIQYRRGGHGADPEADAAAAAT